MQNYRFHTNNNWSHPYSFNSSLQNGYGISAHHGYYQKGKPAAFQEELRELAESRPRYPAGTVINGISVGGQFIPTRGRGSLASLVHPSTGQLEGRHSHQQHHTQHPASHRLRHPLTRRFVDETTPKTMSQAPVSKNPPSEAYDPRLYKDYCDAFRKNDKTRLEWLQQVYRRYGIPYVEC